MSSFLTVTIRGENYQIEKSSEPRKTGPGEWWIDKETFVSPGSNSEQCIGGVTVEEAMRIRDLNRSLMRARAATGECVEYDDDGQKLIWCKETNYLYQPLEQGEEPWKNSITGEICEHYSEKLNAMCMGKMVLDGDQWVPEDKASWNQSDRCCVEGFSWADYDKSEGNYEEE